MQNQVFICKKIKDAFIELLYQKSYEQIKVKDISEKAKISRTVFYIYYSSKADLVKDICDSILDIFADNLMSFFGQRDCGNQQKQIKKAYKYVDENSRVILGLWEIRKEGLSPYELMQDSVKNNCIHYLSQNRASFSLTISENLFAELFSANLMATLKWWLMDHEIHDYEFLADHILRCLNHGLFSLIERQSV